MKRQIDIHKSTNAIIHKHRRKHAPNQTHTTYKQTRTEKLQNTQTTI